MADGRVFSSIDVLSTSRYITTCNSIVHWFQMVVFMAWVKAGRPAQVEEMIRQHEATQSRNMETCPIVLEQAMAEPQGEWMTINREEFFLWSFRQRIISVQFANVLGRVVRVCMVRQLLINANR